MSDGHSEAMRGVYFNNRSENSLTEKEQLERDLRSVEMQIQDLLFERDDLKWKLKKLNE